jgi:peptidoglycan-N-acetylglucosamine deacetylase
MNTVQLKLWPKGKNKALTLSYDDGKRQDRRLVEIIDQYGIRGSFHLNSGRLDHPDFITSAEVKELYNNHEVSVHTVNHPFLEDLPTPLHVSEIIEDRKALEKLVGYPVRGMSYPFGTYSPAVIESLKACGIRCSRTTVSTDNFNIPKDFLEWHATCHHRHEKLMDLAETFLNLGRDGEWRGSEKLNLFYLWGHSYEFDQNVPFNNWGVIENFCKKMGGREEIWYATNIEIADYCNALKALEFSCENTSVYNPSALECWFMSSNSGVVSVKPGETLSL